MGSRWRLAIAISLSLSLTCTQSLSGAINQHAKLANRHQSGTREGELAFVGLKRTLSPVLLPDPSLMLSRKTQRSLLLNTAAVWMLLGQKVPNGEESGHLLQLSAFPQRYKLRGWFIAA